MVDIGDYEIGMLNHPVVAEGNSKTVGYGFDAFREKTVGGNFCIQKRIFLWQMCQNNKKVNMRKKDR